MTKRENDVPFFARYLEGQDRPAVRSGVKAGGLPARFVNVTHKYPSDSEDGPPVTTLKYPSDQEG